MSDTEFQIEFWVPKGRKGGAWVPFVDTGLGAVPRYKTWRKVLVGHKHKDKLSHSIARIKAGPSGISASNKCEAYCIWAKAQGLTSVATYADDYFSNEIAKRFGLEARPMDRDEFLGEAPQPVMED